MTSRYSGWVSSSWRHTNPTIKCGWSQDILDG
jgi:hypothetical protein